MVGHFGVRRLDFGYFVRPAVETSGPQPRVEPVLGYLIQRPEGLILFDTGMGTHPDVEAHYRPRRRELDTALTGAGVSRGDIAAIINCHLHFDHCGGNPGFAGTPIFTQATELAVARRGQYTLDELVDFRGAAYEELDGEAEIWPGVWVIPTPGHTDGHQSLAISEPDGTIILAGQAHDFASHYGSDHLARLATMDRAAPPLPDYRPWMERLAEFDPRRVLFAHDWSAWEPV